MTDQFIYLIHKTGGGKSFFVIATAELLLVVTTVIVWLIGLGSNQVNKSTNLGQYIEAYHVDGFGRCFFFLPGFNSITGVNGVNESDLNSMKLVPSIANCIAYLDSSVLPSLS